MSGCCFLAECAQRLVTVAWPGFYPSKKKEKPTRGKLYRRLHSW